MSQEPNREDANERIHLVPSGGATMNQGQSDDSRQAKHAAGQEEITLDDLKEQFPILKDLPHLTQPNRLTVTQTGELIRTTAMVRDALRQMREADDKKGEDNVADVEAIAWILDKANTYVRGLAEDAETYDEWSRGRNPYDLTGSYIALLSWYEDELGKSENSPASTMSAQ